MFLIKYLHFKGNHYLRSATMMKRTVTYRLINLYKGGILVKFNIEVNFFRAAPGKTLCLLPYSIELLQVFMENSELSNVRGYLVVRVPQERVGGSQKKTKKKHINNFIFARVRLLLKNLNSRFTVGFEFRGVLIFHYKSRDIFSSAFKTCCNLEMVLLEIDITSSK